MHISFYPNEHVPTFFFFLHVNLWGSIAASFQSPPKSFTSFPVSSQRLFILPLRGPNVVMVSQRRAVRLTHVDIPSASGEKALNTAPGCTKQEMSLEKSRNSWNRIKPLQEGPDFNTEHHLTVWKNCGQSASSRAQSDVDLWSQSLIRSEEFNPISSKEITLWLFSCPA